MTTQTPLLQVRDLVHEFHTNGGTVHAVSGVSFDVWAGETLGIVGETGSGKSTLARSILQAPRPTSGEVTLRGADLTTLRGARLLQARRHLQMVFQDPFGSLDPKWRVRDLVEEPLIAYRTGDRNTRRRRVDEVLEMVGLDPAGHGARRPRELSGGQAQRVAIARAIALNPALVICDEAVSSLDVLIQAQVLNLFEQLRAELGLSYLFIAHDLALVKQVSDRVAVMYLGKPARAAPRRRLRPDPGPGPGGRGGRVRRLLPLRPLSGHRPGRHRLPTAGEQPYVAIRTGPGNLFAATNPDRRILCFPAISGPFRPAGRGRACRCSQPTGGKLVAVVVETVTANTEHIHHGTRCGPW